MHQDDANVGRCILNQTPGYSFATACAVPNNIENVKALAASKPDADGHLIGGAIAISEGLTKEETVSVVCHTIGDLMGLENVEDSSSCTSHASFEPEVLRWYTQADTDQVLALNAHGDSGATTTSTTVAPATTTTEPPETTTTTEAPTTDTTERTGSTPLMGLRRCEVGRPPGRATGAPSDDHEELAEPHDLEDATCAWARGPEHDVTVALPLTLEGQHELVQPAGVDERESGHVHDDRQGPGVLQVLDRLPQASRIGEVDLADEAHRRAPVEDDSLDVQFAGTEALG